MKKKVKIITGICSCLGTKNKREAVRDTWLKHPAEGIECLFFVGAKEPPPGEEEDTVALDAPDGYNELPAKVRAFFLHALQHYDFEWLFKCDDDTYLDLTRLESAADADYDLIGDPSILIRQSPSGGAGYFLKRSMVEKLVEASGFAMTGAEDVIVGEMVTRLGGTMKSTRRLYMSNTAYPNAENDMVTAHWCIPDIMRAIYQINHQEPSLICDAVHHYWKGGMLFYASGVFKRKDTSCYGWWSIGPKGELTLKWQMWPMEQLLLEGDTYIGSETKIIQRPGVTSLYQLWTRKNQPAPHVEVMDQSPFLYVHLGCGERRLKGWLNLDAPNYDITRPLPWKDATIDAYYLEHAIDRITPAQACRFFEEALRSLKPGGLLRLSFRDIHRMRGMVTPAFRQYMKEKLNGTRIPPHDLGALIEVYGHQSLWTADFLSYLLEELGFQVTQHSPGVSNYLHLQCLERRTDRDERPFDLLGSVCLDARKPEHETSPAFLSVHPVPQQKPCSYLTLRFLPGSRTGNYLFQIAAVYAHSLRMKTECRIPWRHNPDTWNLMTCLGEACSPCPDGGYDAPAAYLESGLSFQPIPGTVQEGALEGFFRSEHYFEEFSEEVRTLFSPLTAPVREGTAGIHLNMKDYVRATDLDHEPVSTFLHKALLNLSGNIRELAIFSDSPELAREIIRNIPETKRFNVVVDNHSPLDALRELTSMQELILSCSSFSWWGAWLGRQKKVFVQKQGSGEGNRKEQDIFLPHWIRL